jgi:hypothetical protein
MYQFMYHFKQGRHGHHQEMAGVPLLSDPQETRHESR